MSIAISVENLSKSYQLGQIGTGTFAQDLSVWWAKLRGKPNPMLKIGEQDHGNREGGQLWALKDISFTVQQGEALGIIGRNGAGKSTLLKILSRVTAPTSGRVKVKGRIASLLEVGTGFHPELTGRENIYLNGSILGMNRGEINRKFDEIVNFSEVEKFIDTPVKRYSSGMYVRLAFAVAAHLDPEILVVDEVLAVGDAEFQKKCLGKMGDVAQGGRTVLFVSHNMGAVNALCGRSVLLHRGQILKIGETESIVSQYLSSQIVSQPADLASLRWKGMGKTARFTNIQLQNAQKGYLLFGEPLDISLSVFAEQNAANISIGASLFNISGVCVGTFFSKETFSLTAGATRGVRLKMENLNLAPGNYYMAFSLGQGGSIGKRRDVDVISGAPVFQVAQIGVDGRDIPHWHPNWGNIVITDVKLTLE